MYEAYWKLSRKPFSQRMSAQQLYRSQSQQAALLRLRYCIDNCCGLGLLSGASGTGKSSLLRTLATEAPLLRPFVQIIFPLLNSDELLRLVASELLATDLPPQSSDTDHTSLAADAAGNAGLLRCIQQSLQRHVQAGRHPIICFDDAHQLSDQVLQSVVQPLLNLTDCSEQLRFSVVLCGQPVLVSRLRKHTQISDRIGVMAALQGLTVEETADYVLTSLRDAGATQPIFTDSALQRLFEVSAGNPRRLNRLCDMALLVGFAEQLLQITDAEINAVSHELLPAAA